MDKQMGPFIRFAGDAPVRASVDIALMSCVWDSARVHPPGLVRTLGLRDNVGAPLWTHAVSEVTWGSVAYLHQPASSNDEVEARHEELVALLQSLPWPQGFDEAVRRWGIAPVSRDLPPSLP